MARLIGFCGAGGSGKTTLLCGVVSRLAARGLAVGAIKHHGHPEPLAAAERAKDTDRLLAAGAARVALSHAGGVWLFAGAQAAAGGPAQMADSFLPGLDLVLVEGYKTSEIDKIEVVAPGREPLLPAGGRLLALARRGGGGVEAGLPVLDADDPEAVAGMVLEHLADTGPGGAGREPAPVGLWVDGRELEMNPFVSRLVERTLRGLVAGLKGGAGARRIEIKIGE
jgi:molybdopterin-guanine dinucleotide biosynthesis protein MobB